MRTDVMGDGHEALLDEAITRNAGIVLSLPSGGILRHHKSRFLGREQAGFWVQSVPAELPLIQELLARQGTCGVSFKSGITKVIFASPARRLDPQFRLDAHTTTEALLLAYPEQVKAVQRRAAQRVPVAPDDELSLRLWRIGRRADLRDAPLPSQQVPARLVDISTGGVGILLPGDGAQPARVTCDDRLRIALSRLGHTLLIEGRMRHPTTPIKQPNVRAGLAFSPLPDDVDGRQQLAQLNRLVGELQRREVRRLHLGVTMTG